MGFAQATKVALAALGLSACVSVKAKVPDDLAVGSRRWSVTLPKSGFLFFVDPLAKISAGPYRTSDIATSLSRDIALKLGWSDSAAERSSERQWLSFDVRKGRKVLGWVACDRSRAGTEYRRGSMTISTASDERVCEVTVNGKSIILKIRPDLVEVAPHGTDAAPGLLIRASTGTVPTTRYPDPTGFTFVAPNTPKPVLAWLKTMHDGEPQELVLAKGLGTQQVDMIVTTAFAYLAMDYYAEEADQNR